MEGNGRWWEQNKKKENGGDGDEQYKNRLFIHIIIKKDIEMITLLSF